MNSIRNYLKLMSYIGEYRVRRFKITLLCAFSVILYAIAPYMIGRLVNMVQNSEDFSKVLNFGILLIILGILQAFFDSYQNYKWHTYRVEYMNYFRSIMLKGALDKSPEYYKQNPSDLTSRILHDCETVSEDISIGLPMLFLNVLNISIVLGLMFYMSFKLAIIVLFVIPIYTIFFKKVDSAIRKNSKDEREHFALVTESVKEYTDGIFQIKIFGKEQFFLNKFRENIKKYEIYLKNVKKYTAIGYGLTGLIVILLPIVILLFGAMEVNSGNMSLGSLFAFYFYLGYLYEPMRNLSDWFSGVQVTLGMSDRILEFVDSAEVEDKKEAISSIDTIKVENLTFSYDEKNYIFKNFNTEMEKGDIIGIVGPSGSGKSTLVDLLLKRILNYNGKITINGIDLKDINRTSYYNFISYLEQDAFLFKGSLKENIAFDSFDEDNFEISTELSQAKKFNTKKDGNFEIEIKGKNVSGGEKQRIALARALYKNSNLLILDEFTSALDFETEQEVVKNIEKISNDKIILIITHRKLPLSICNKLIDLEK